MAIAAILGIVGKVAGSAVGQAAMSAVSAASSLPAVPGAKDASGNRVPDAPSVQGGGSPEASRATVGTELAPSVAAPQAPRLGLAAGGLGSNEFSGFLTNAGGRTEIDLGALRGSQDTSPRLFSDEFEAKNAQTLQSVESGPKTVGEVATQEGGAGSRIFGTLEDPDRGGGFLSGVADGINAVAGESIGSLEDSRADGGFLEDIADVSATLQGKVLPSEARRRSDTEPGTLQKILSPISDIVSASQGRGLTSVQAADRRRNLDLDERRLDIVEASRGFEVVGDLVKRADTMTGEKRREFLGSLTPVVSESFGDFGPQIAKVLAFERDNPGTIPKDFDTMRQQNPELDAIFQAKGLVGMRAWLSNNDNLLLMRERSDLAKSGQIQRKADRALDFLERNHPDKLKRARRDGVTSPGELRALNALLPEGPNSIRLTEDQLGNILRNPTAYPELIDVPSIVEANKKQRIENAGKDYEQGLKKEFENFKVGLPPTSTVMIESARHFTPESLAKVVAPGGTIADIELRAPAVDVLDEKEKADLAKEFTGASVDLFSTTNNASDLIPRAEEGKGPTLSQLATMAKFFDADSIKLFQKTADVTDLVALEDTAKADSDAAKAVNDVLAEIDDGSRSMTQGATLNRIMHSTSGRAVIGMKGSFGLFGGAIAELIPGGTPQRGHEAAEWFSSVFGTDRAIDPDTGEHLIDPKTGQTVTSQADIKQITQFQLMANTFTNANIDILTGEESGRITEAERELARSAARLVTKTTTQSQAIEAMQTLLTLRVISNERLRSNAGLGFRHDLDTESGRNDLQVLFMMMGYNALDAVKASEKVQIDRQINSGFVQDLVDRVTQ